MVINSTDFSKIPGLINATLSETTEGVSTLTLEFDGFADEIDAAELEWMAPWSILHAGRLLFSGRVTDLTRTNIAEAKTTNVVISNAMWLLDNVPYGAQLDEIRAAAEQQTEHDSQLGGYPNLIEPTVETFATWQKAAEVCHVEAPLWLADSAGNPRVDGALTLDVTRANEAIYTSFRPEGVITAWTGLLAMREANPDALFRFNYDNGAVEVISLENAPTITYDTSEGAQSIPEISDISPQYQNRCEGVACVVTWYWEEMYSILGKYHAQFGQATHWNNRIKRDIMLSILEQYIDDDYIVQLRDAGFNVDDPEEYAGSLSFTYPEEGVEMGASLVKIVNATCYTRTQAEEQAAYIRSQVETYFNACNVANWAGSLSVLMEDVETSPLAYRMNIIGDGTHPSWHNMCAVVSGVDWDFLEGRVSITLGFTPPGGDFKGLEFEQPVLPGAISRSDESTADDTRLRSYSLPEFFTNITRETDHWTYSKDTDESTYTGSGGSEDTGTHTGTTTPDHSFTMPGGCDCAVKWDANDKRLDSIDKEIEEIKKKLEEKCDCAERLFALLQGVIKEQVNAVTLNAVVETDLNTNDNGTVVSTSSFNITPHGGGTAAVKYGYKQ